MKQKYEEPEMEVIMFETEDVIITSDIPDPDEGPFIPWTNN